MSDIIIYGGAFNPPTIAHKQIGEYLLNKYKDKKIIYLPTNSFYNKEDLASFRDRYNMTKLLVKDLGKRVEVSKYEGKEHEFSGTYYTLIHYKHPYFVIGADSLKNLPSWIEGKKLIEENHFIVFPRKGYDINEILKLDIIKDNINNFIIESSFDENDISSSIFRSLKDEKVLTEEVKNYIKKKGLYR